MSLISKWFPTTLVKDDDSQNTPEVDLQDSFEAIEIDIPVLSAEAELQIKGSNSSGGTFDLIGQEEPVPSSAGGFRTTVPLGGKYQFIKVYLSAAQTSDRIFAVRGISYASGGLVTLIDRLKNMRIDVGDIEVNTADIEDGIDELKVLVGAISASPTENTVLERLLAVETALTAINTLIGAIAASPTQYTVNDRLKQVEAGIDEVKVLIGEVSATPTENSLLERLKTLETTIVLAAGSAAIGKLAANSGVDIGDVDVASLPSVASATNTKVSVGSSDTTVLASSATRKFAVFVNDSDEVIYLSLSATAVINEGIRLNAGGGAYEINLMNLYTGEVSGICASGTKNLTVVSG